MKGHTEDLNNINNTRRIMKLKPYAIYRKAYEQEKALHELEIVKDLGNEVALSDGKTILKSNIEFK